MNVQTPHVVIAGAGMTGLSAAYYLQKTLKEKGQKWQITLLEASGRLGGKVKTLVRDGFVMEQGPDSFLERKKSAFELAKDLGLEDQLVRNQTGQAYILHKDELLPIPEGAVMGSPDPDHAVCPHSFGVPGRQSPCRGRPGSSPFQCGGRS